MGIGITLWSVKLVIEVLIQWLNTFKTSLCKASCLWFHHIDNHQRSSRVVSVACQGLPSAPESFKAWMVGGFYNTVAARYVLTKISLWIHCDFIRDRKSAPKVALSARALTSRVSAILGLPFLALPNFEQ